MTRPHPLWGPRAPYVKVSPLRRFIADCCVVQPAAMVECPDIFACWEAWLDFDATEAPGTQQTFGRELRTAIPGITVCNLRNDDGTRSRYYRGINITVKASKDTKDWIAARDSTAAMFAHLRRPEPSLHRAEMGQLAQKRMMK